MRALKVATIAMAVMIVAGTALLAVLIVRRVSPTGPSSAAVALHEPAGARIVGIAATPAGLAVAVQGGGPDRILILDPRSLRERARVMLGGSGVPDAPAP